MKVIFNYKIQDPLSPKSLQVLAQLKTQTECDQRHPKTFNAVWKFKYKYTNTHKYTDFSHFHKYTNTKTL